MTQEQLNALVQAMLSNGLTNEETTSVAHQLINANMTYEQAVAAVQQLLAKRAQPQVVAQQNVVAQPQQANTVQTNVGINNLLALAAVAGEGDDHSVVRAGFAPAEAGFATMRLKGYIEVGVHKPSNVKHKNREMVHVVMEVNTQNHLINEDGVMKPREIVIRTPKAHSNNAGFPRLFAALNACHNNKYKHIGEMLGAEFVGQIYHSKPDSNGRVWENFDNDKVWSFAPAVGKNLDGTPYSIQVPELVSAPMMFVFDNPKLTDPNHIKQMWDSIYIPGTRESEKNGQTVQTSKNYYQETLRASLTWDKSKTKQLLSTVCAPETLTAIAPRETQAQQKAEQTPSLGATLQPAQIQQPTVQPAVQPAVGNQPTVNNGLTLQPEVLQTQESANVGVATQQNVMPSVSPVEQLQVSTEQQMSVAPITVDVNAQEPQVVNVSPTFVAPQTEQQQVQAQPTVAQVQVTPQATGGDVSEWLQQFAAQG